MSLSCRFGDEDVSSAETVPCRLDPATNTAYCRQAGGSRQLPLRDFKMELTLVNEDEEDAREDETSSLIARQEQSSGEHNLAEQHQCINLRHKVLRTMLAAMAGEFIGTCLLTLVICTSVAVSVVAGAHVGLWQVAVVIGLGVAMSIYLTASFSDAHLNPAVTLAFATVRCRSFVWWKVVPYMLAQLLGGVAAGGLLLATYGQAISNFEADNNITRGADGSQLSAMLFGEYFPNPAVYSHNHLTSLSVASPAVALFVECWGTAILVFTVFALTDRHNTSVNQSLVPLLIGFTVAMLISLYAPITQAGFNPARDFGPRLVAAIAGWGSIAVPGPRGGFWVYILGPLIGGPIGGAAYDLVVANLARFARTEYRPEGPKEHGVETPIIHDTRL